MKLFTFWSKSVERMKDEILIPSMIDGEYELIDIETPNLCESGVVDGEGFKQLSFDRLKSLAGIIRSEKDPFLHCDIDVQFLAPSKDVLMEELGDYDIAFMDDYGTACCGFHICRPSKKLADFFDLCYETDGVNDQDALNKIIRTSDLRWKLLSGLFWNYGHHRRGIWVQYNWDSMDIPSDILVHHANFTYGQDNKIAMASRVEIGSVF